jgi:hypothetical protein
MRVERLLGLLNGFRGMRDEQEKSKVKTRSLKTEGCGTQFCLTAKGLPPAKRSNQ